MRTLSLIVFASALMTFAGALSHRPAAHASSMVGANPIPVCPDPNCTAGR